MTLLPALSEDVVVNGLTLNYVDSSGTAWWMSDLDGWWDLPDVDVPDEDRPAPFDGGYDLEGRFKTRLITLIGGFRPATFENTSNARVALLTALRLVHMSGVIQVNEDVPKQCSVKLSGRPVLSTVDSTGTTTFEVAFKAADPRKYSVQETIINITVPTIIPDAGITPPLTPPLNLPTSISQADVTVTNDGDYETGLIVTFFGAVDQPTLINETTGQFILFNTTIADGDSLIVDTDARSALVNGIDSQSFTITSDSRWFSLPPGETILRFQAASAGVSATARVQFRSAWID